jgi:hypothetical protein
MVSSASLYERSTGTLAQHLFLLAAFSLCWSATANSDQQQECGVNQKPAQPQLQIKHTHLEKKCYAHGPFGGSIRFLYFRTVV